MNLTRTAVVMAVGIAVLASACSDTVSPDVIDQVEARCEDVPQATLDYIATGLTVEQGSLRNGAGVKSDYGPDLWIVAAEVDGVGFEGDGDIAAWALVTGLDVDQVEGVAAVEDFARATSTWGDDLGNELSSLIDGVSAALACVDLGESG